MIYFDRKTLAVLRYIKRSGDKGISLRKLREKYSEDANIFLLESFFNEDYVVVKNDKGDWIFTGEFPRSTKGRFRFYSTPKANELIEIRIFNFWKWVIPTLISVVALVMSIITFAVQ